MECLRNVATGCFIFLCLSGICLLPGSNVCGSLFHLEAFLPGTIIAICISLEETTENDPNMCISHVNISKWAEALTTTTTKKPCLLWANICVRKAASWLFCFHCPYHQVNFVAIAQGHIFSSHFTSLRAKGKPRSHQIRPPPPEAGRFAQDSRVNFWQTWGLNRHLLTQV